MSVTWQGSLGLYKCQCREDRWRFDQCTSRGVCRDVWRWCSRLQTDWGCSAPIRLNLAVCNTCTFYLGVWTAFIVTCTETHIKWNNPRPNLYNTQDRAAGLHVKLGDRTGKRGAGGHETTLQTWRLTSFYKRRVKPWFVWGFLYSDWAVCICTGGT